MGKPWTEVLTESEISFMNEIVAQVPEQHGVRTVFIDILQKLADHAGDVKFRYVIAATDFGDVYGTNDREQALLYAGDESNYVIDTVESKWIPAVDEGEATDILQASVIESSDDHGDDE